MKSVFHIALISPNGYTAKPFVKAFFDNGFNSYHVFDFQLKYFEFGKERMRQMLIEEAKKVKPDLIFAQVQASDILDIDTWKELAKISYTVNYTFDIRSKEQSEWLYDLCGVAGLVCFSNYRDAKECLSRGYDNVIALHSSADMEVYQPIVVQGKQRNKIVFIGNNYVGTNLDFPKAKERFDMVSRLSEKYGDDFAVYGNGWPNSRLVSGLEESAIYSCCDIAINQNNFKEEDYVSDRLWRIMATGAFCLTSYFEGIEKLFLKGEHLDWWDSMDRLEFLIDYYLNNPDQRNYAALSGSAAVRENHTWTNRIKSIMSYSPSPQVDKKENCNKMGAHVVDGIIPGPMDKQFDGRTCDCSKLKFSWEECGCAIKEYQLRATENI